MKAEIVPTEAAAPDFSARAFSRNDARARDLTLSKIRSPRASVPGGFAFQKEVNDV